MGQQKDYIDIPMTPAEIQRLKAGNDYTDTPAAPPQTWKEAINDVGVGALKGVAETTTNAVGLIPGVTWATNALGNAVGGAAGRALYGTTPEPVSQQSVSNALESTNTAQTVGKGAEQLAEFFVPAQAARKAAIEGLVRLIPNSASPGTMRVLNKAGAIIGRTVGEFGSAAAVSAAHGDPHPERTGMAAAAGPLVGAVAGPAVKVLKYELSKDLLATIAAIAGANTLGGITTLGLGGGFASFHMTRAVASKLLANPRVIPTLTNLVRSGSAEAARLLSALNSVANTDDGTAEHAK